MRYRAINILSIRLHLLCRSPWNAISHAHVLRREIPRGSRILRPLVVTVSFLEVNHYLLEGEQRRQLLLPGLWQETSMSPGTMVLWSEFSGLCADSAVVI